MHWPNAWSGLRAVASRVTGNGCGDVMTTAQADMAAFDQLPGPVRAVMREAPFNYASETILKFWQGRTGRSPEPVAAMMLADFIVKDAETKVARVAAGGPLILGSRNVQ